MWYQAVITAAQLKTSGFFLKLLTSLLLILIDEGIHRWAGLINDPPIRTGRDGITWLQSTNSRPGI